MTFHHAILLKIDNRPILIFSNYILSQVIYKQCTDLHHGWHLFI